MKLFNHKYKLILSCVFCMNFMILSAQSYKKDSLQIKSYTVIEFVNNKIKSIELSKVLCDYCNEIQKKAIGKEALQRTYAESQNPKNRLENGKKKLAIYIRIAKKDFAAIKDE